MADMRKKRTVIGREDPDFNDLVNNLARFKAQQERINITPSKIGRAHV